MSAWEHFNGLFNFDANPIGPIGCPVIIHNKPGTCLSWDFHIHKGFNIGPAMQHYQCFHMFDAVTKHLLFSDTVEFLHVYLPQPNVSPTDRIVHELNFLSCAIKESFQIMSTTNNSSPTPVSVISSPTRSNPRPCLPQPQTRSHLYPLLSQFCLSKATPLFHLQGWFHFQGWNHLQR